jgi:hypothetical protein
MTWIRRRVMRGPREFTVTRPERSRSLWMRRVDRARCEGKRSLRLKEGLLAPAPTLSPSGGTPARIGSASSKLPKGSPPRPRRHIHQRTRATLAARAAALFAAAPPGVARRPSTVGAGRRSQAARQLRTARAGRSDVASSARRPVVQPGYERREQNRRRLPRQRNCASERGLTAVQAALGSACIAVSASWTTAGPPQRSRPAGGCQPDRAA